MKISKKYALIALIIAVNLNTILLFSMVFYNTSETTFEKLTGQPTQASISMCLDQYINIIQLPDQNINTNAPYSVDVNVSNEESYVALNFTDNTNLFNITSGTGLINFTPTNAQYGEYSINITIGNFQCIVYDDSMVFNLTINYSNHAPILNLSSNFTNLAQSTLFYFNVSNNVTDVDNDPLLFYDNTTLFNINENTGIIAFTPTNSQIGNHSVKISVSDGLAIDDQDIIFSIMNVNDAPVLAQIGAKTAYVNRTFKINISAYDIDAYENLTFVSNYSWFLNMSGPNATVNTYVNMSLIFNFSNFTYWNGTHNINVTVNDTSNAQDSEVFALTVTFFNYPPNITSYYPSEKAFSANIGSQIYFNITKDDLNGGTPSTAWLLNNVAMDTDDEFTWDTSGNSTGNYNITARVTDGEYDDAESWIVSLTTPPPPPPVPVMGSSVGGGGFGGNVTRMVCQELWVCSDWETCPVSGIQGRECNDLHNCKGIYRKPNETRKCTYVEFPSCYDSVRNQDEVLADCGGICTPCPTCDDKVKNHGEESIDCGGPCPACQEVREPARDFKMALSSSAMVKDINNYWLVWFLITIILLSAIRSCSYLAHKGRNHIIDSVMTPIRVIMIKMLTIRISLLLKSNRIEKAKRLYKRVKSIYLKLPTKVMKRIKI